MQAWLDAAFANPEIYEFLEAEGMGYANRLPTNRVVQDKIGYLLQRPVRRPPHEVRRHYASFIYQARSCKEPRRVVTKVEWHPGELCPRVGFIVTNLARPAERVVAFYIAARRSNDRGGQGRDQMGAAVMPLPSSPTRSVYSFTHSPTTSATSCGRSRCPRRRSRGR